MLGGIDFSLYALQSSKKGKIDMFEFMEMFHDEESARKQFEKLLWRGKRFCGHCGSKRTKRVKHPTMKDLGGMPEENLIVMKLHMR